MANTLDVKSLLKHLVDGDFEEKLCRICLQPLSGLCENIFTKICKENQEYCVADALEELCDFKFAETDNYLVCTECFLNASNAYKFFLNTKRNNEILTFYINEIESNINAIEIPDTVLTDTLCISLPELTPATPNFDYNLDGVLLPCRQEAPKHASIKNENIDDEPTVQIDEEHLVIVKSEDGTQTFYKSLPDGSLMEMVLDKKKKEIQVEKKARKKREPMLYRQCSVCPIKYRFIAKLKEHMRTEHGITLHVCKICQALIEDEEEFRRHLKTHTNIHQCELCDTVFRRRDTMIAHLKWHEDSQNSTGKHVCTTCGEIAKDEDELIDHIDKKHNKNYTCYYCGRMYKGKISFDQHIEKHEKYSKQKEKMELLDKTLKPTGSPLEVPLCPIKKRRLSNIHFFPKPPTATSDSATMEVFTHSVKSIAHSSKNPELQSRIEAASLPIKRKNPEKRLIEAKQKPSEPPPAIRDAKRFTCETCGRNFLGERALMWHNRLHTNERPYACDVCGKSFVSENRRKQHALCAHTVPTRRCPLCPALFHLRSMVNTHIKKVHLKAHKRRNRTMRPQQVFWDTQPVPIQELSVSIQNEILELQAREKETLEVQEREVLHVSGI